MAQIRYDVNKVLCELYEAQDLSVDRLPYSKEFEDIWAVFCSQTHKDVTHRELWLLLMALRKDGTLPRKSEKRIRNKKQPRRELKPVQREGGFNI